MKIPASLVSAISQYLVEILLSVGQTVVEWIATHEYIGNRRGALDFITGLDPDHENIMVIDLNRELSWIKAKRLEGK